MIKAAKLQTTGVSQLMSLKTVHSSPQKQAGKILRCKCSDKHKQIWFCKGFLASDRVFTLKTINNSCLQRGKLTRYGISTKFVNLSQGMYSSPKLCVGLSKGLTKSFSS